MIVAAAAAYIAGDINVGQEIHHDAFLAVALAGFAASALDVKAEAAGLVTARARFGQHRKQIADMREDLSIGRWIRARRAADGGLIDLDHFIDQIEPVDGCVRAGLRMRIVDVLGGSAIQNIVHQRRFAAARNAGDRR